MQPSVMSEVGGALCEHVAVDFSASINLPCERPHAVRQIGRNAVKRVRLCMTLGGCIAWAMMNCKIPLRQLQSNVRNVFHLLMPLDAFFFGILGQVDLC